MQHDTNGDKYLPSWMPSQYPHLQRTLDLAGFEKA